MCIGKLSTDGVQPNVQSRKHSLKTDTHTDSKSKQVESLKVEWVGECREVWLPLKQITQTTEQTTVGDKCLLLEVLTRSPILFFAPFTWLPWGTDQLIASSGQPAQVTEPVVRYWQLMVSSGQPAWIPESALFLCLHKKKNVTTYGWAGRTLWKATGGNRHCSPLRTPIAQTAASHTVTGIGCKAPFVG